MVNLVLSEMIFGREGKHIFFVKMWEGVGVAEVILVAFRAGTHFPRTVMLAILKIRDTTLIA